MSTPPSAGQAGLVLTDSDRWDEARDALMLNRKRAAVISAELQTSFAQSPLIRPSEYAITVQSGSPPPIRHLGRAKTFLA